MKLENDLDTDDIRRLVLRLALPSMLAQFVSVFYSIVDRMYIGNIPKIGEVALAGVGICGPIVTLVSSFAILVGVGGAPLMSIRLGQKNEKGARQILANCFLMLTVMALVLTVCVLGMREKLLWWFGAGETTFPYALSYMTIYLCGTFFALMTTGMNQFIICQGFAKVGMKAVMIGAVANIVLDPIFIFGLFGVPRMEAAGAAVATVAGQWIGAAAGLTMNLLCNKDINLTLKGFRPAGSTIKRIYAVGIPSIAMNAIGSVMTFAVNGILLGVSSTAVAFFGIYYKLQNFLMMPVNGLGQAAIPVVGFNYGSGQSDRVKQAWEVLLPTGVVFALCGMAVFLLFPAQLLGLFSASDEMLAFGVPALRIISVTFLFAVTTILCGYFASGLGNGVVNMIGGALRQLVVLVPCLWLLIRTMGIDKAWFAFWMSEIVACAYSLWATKKELRNKGK